MFKIKNINKYFKDYKALDNVNLNIPNNKLVSIIGPNGAGKSTLLGAISRLNKINSGTISLEEKNIKDWDRCDLSKTLSIMKQMHSMNTRLTIYDLVSFGRYPYSKDKLTKEDFSIIDNSIKYSGLWELKDKFIEELSGGQRQRAYIAMVLAQDTKYLLLDEPLNNLDMKHILEVMTLLRKLVKEQNKSIVIVIHDINVAASYSDYIIAMKNGSIAAKGSPEKIIRKDILSRIYEIDFEIEEVNNKKICLYY